MTKKGTGKTYTSKGERPNVSKKWKIRKDRSDLKEMMEQNLRSFYAYISGKNAYVTIPNPNPNDTRARFIRVSAREHFNNTLGTSEEGKKGKDKYLMNRYYVFKNQGEEDNV